MKLQNVTCYSDAHTNARPLLNRLNLSIEDSEWLSIVGRNGSGKYTLAKLLSGIIAPAEGMITSGHSDGGPIPYVMQEDYPFIGETAWEELIFALESRGEPAYRIADTAHSILQQTGLTHLMHQPLKELSGGQRQLVAAACCLACRAPMLIFDEAVSMLDSASQELVLRLARQLHQSGTTIVWLTHQLSEVADGDRVAVMEDGRIAYEGTTADFFYGASPRQANIATPCEQAGFEPPYPVRIALHLLRSGTDLKQYPLTASQLSEVLNHHER